MDEKVLRLRLDREKAIDSDELQASLVWNDPCDLDLHVVPPSGETISYDHKESRCGGWLDVDMNVNGESLTPVENVFWASSPSGKYTIKVNCYSMHCKDGFTDPKRVVPYRVFLTKNGKREIYNGEITSKQTQTCFQFNHKGSGALGSFVVLPPSDKKETFDSLAERSKVPYNKGSGYYAVCKKEKIQKYKDLLLHNIKKDTFDLGHADVCEALGWEDGVDLNKGPKEIKAGYRLFVQSTSANRVILPGTHALVQVSVKDAIKYRATGNSVFGTGGDKKSEGKGKKDESSEDDSEEEEEKKPTKKASRKPAAKRGKKDDSSSSSSSSDSDSEEEKSKRKTAKKAAKKASRKPSAKKSKKDESSDDSSDESSEEKPTKKRKNAEKEKSSKKQKTGLTLSGKNVLITGTLENFTRSEAQKAAQKAGATCKSSLTKVVNLVVKGTGNPKSVPSDHPAQIIDEEEFRKLL
eukprot:TRINITY_DN3036_c0_g1_i1.p1 TRINITY_DN3036_c0_g1~~TRINITY_DN3036_c0_g1_i1.p1  ORF type:complete len:466 (+),score=118.69 TRINITY_DN3036_c0_g1_i1:52-1449(+)